MDSKTKGILAEDAAEKFLTEKGFEILERNYRHRAAEIDMIALQDNRLLVFVEVKHRSNNAFGEPETFVTEPQQERIMNAADDYIHAINWKGDIRFDIISVEERNEIRHFEDAFY